LFVEAREILAMNARLGARIDRALGHGGVAHLHRQVCEREKGQRTGKREEIARGVRNNTAKKNREYEVNRWAPSDHGEGVTRQGQGQGQGQGGGE
jgi:hypothetical protein